MPKDAQGGKVSLAHTLLLLAHCTTDSVLPRGIRAVKNFLTNFRDLGDPWYLAEDSHFSVFPFIHTCTLPLVLTQYIQQMHQCK